MSLQIGFYLSKLKRNLRRKPSELKEMQTKKLRAILRHAYRDVLFYHRKFKSARLDPESIKCIEDLGKVPVTTKNELQSIPLREAVANSVDMSRCIKRTTSGSTGQPLTVCVNMTAERFEEALWLRAMLENGLRLRDRMVVLHDPTSVFIKSSNWLKYLGILRRESISFFEDANRQLKLLEEYAPQVIKSYPSTLAILADLSKKKHCSIKPRLIFTGAELQDDTTRKFISSTFEAEVLDNYGCNEFSLMAWECRQHSGYHINIDSVVMEFVDRGEDVSSGERGEVVCTTLINQAMPLIRYKVGDVGVPSEEQCSCGRTLPLMEVIEGRADDFLVTLDGKIVSPLVFFPYPFENFELIKQFRVIQDKRDELTVQVVLKKDLKDNSELFTKARLELVKLFGADMQVKFKLLESIDRDSSGKLRKIISHVSIDDFFGQSP